MEIENIESVETKNEEVITESPAGSENVYNDSDSTESAKPNDETEETLGTDNVSNVSSENNKTDTPETESSKEILEENQVNTVYEEPIHEVYCTVECNCQDTTLLWESDISQYNITNGLLLMILVALCFNIIMRK